MSIPTHCVIPKMWYLHLSNSIFRFFLKRLYILMILIMTMTAIPAAVNGMTAPTMISISYSFLLPSAQKKSSGVGGALSNWHEQL